jgi:hypothetical protein
VNDKKPLEPRHLGGGTVLFENAITVPQNDLISYLENEKELWRKENFTVIYDDNGEPIHAINKGGFIYGLDSYKSAPVRIQNLTHPFFKECDDRVYDALLSYIEMFPAILQCLWWKSGGHVLCYDEGASLGFHSDNDVNYRYGAMPQLDHATRNVVSALVYFNSCTDDGSECDYGFSGGHMSIPYFDIDIVPHTGSIVLMPANYLGAHQIHEITKGSRYSYLLWFAQGVPAPEHGVNPVAPDGDYHSGGQWWLETLVEDYEKYINEKYPLGSSRPDNLTLFKSRAKDHYTK